MIAGPIERAGFIEAPRTDHDRRRGRNVRGGPERDEAGVELGPVCHAKDQEDQTEGENDLEEHRLDVLPRLDPMRARLPAVPKNSQARNEPKIAAAIWTAK